MKNQPEKLLPTPDQNIFNIWFWNDRNWRTIQFHKGDTIWMMNALEWEWMDLYITVWNFLFFFKKWFIDFQNLYPNYLGISIKQLLIANEDSPDYKNHKTLLNNILLSIKSYCKDFMDMDITLTELKDKVTNEAIPLCCRRLSVIKSTVHVPTPRNTYYADFINAVLLRMYATSIHQALDLENAVKLALPQNGQQKSLTLEQIMEMESF